MAGATAVSVGTANFHNPYATQEIVEGMEAYMKKYQVEDINEPDRHCKIERVKNVEENEQDRSL